MKNILPLETNHNRGEKWHNRENTRKILKNQNNAWQWRRSTKDLQQGNND